MSPRHRIHSLHVMLSCLLGLLLLATAWPRTVQSAELMHKASAAHAALVMHDEGQGSNQDGDGSLLVLEDNCGMDDILHLPTIIDVCLVPMGSAVVAAGPYAVRQRDIALLLRPPETA